MRIQPLDSLRMRVYIAPRGLWLTLDSGTFESVAVNTRNHAVRERDAYSIPLKGSVTWIDLIDSK